MSNKLEFLLTLHVGDANGVRTYTNSPESFVTVFPLEGLSEEDLTESIEALIRDRGDFAGIFVLTGRDPAIREPLLYMTAGDVEATLKSLSGELLAKEKVFTRLLILGTWKAVEYLPMVYNMLNRPNEISYHFLNDRDDEFRRVSDQDEDLVFTTFSIWPVMGSWKQILDTFTIPLIGLGGCAARDFESPEVEIPCDDRLFFCTGRGADARARWSGNGIRILAGSRSSPYDATPSLQQAFRETIKNLVGEGKLKKIDGVWVFVEDVWLASPVKAASILMRTAAGADAWKREDGVALTELIRKKDTKKIEA